MNNSNSYNICPRCGTANGLNAKYCYQCGGQLKVPEEPIVCPRCHTVNSGLANFCRNCGTTLKVGAQTKICPRCKKEVNIEDNVCACGYSFATIRAVSPKSNATDGTSKKVNLSHSKGGRAVALFALLFLLVFAYLAVCPTTFEIKSNPVRLRYSFMLVDEGIIYNTENCLYGYDIVKNIVEMVISKADLTALSLSYWIIGGLTTLFALTMAIQLLCAIIHLIGGKRIRKSNGLYLVLFFVSLIATALVVVPAFLPTVAFLQSFASISDGVSTYAWGYELFAIPVYYLFFFIYSLITKVKKSI